jgi:hypothetical protein
VYLLLLECAARARQFNKSVDRSKHVFRPTGFVSASRKLRHSIGVSQCALWAAPSVPSDMRKPRVAERSTFCCKAVMSKFWAT